ncbi:30S ribosomal protein S24e [Methanocaldococcus villosus KIN24-T80]|uniref:Small ribosomal subunit protein eS24 n=1 Tax=Methanocaldococcus villosus KIN24-T80 TaxID=1069083 RepID=N6W008_9EURY|nr:30S ribosomal protein S24e [Methanocaldococcus villosus]ENN96682.1 30S ribosomal protein S24e [Methanocaldococcus villosus KIN24-T80]
MEIKIVSDRYNPLLKRREIKFILDHEGATPTFKDVRSKLCAMFNVDKNLLILEKIVEETGMQRCRGYVKIYDDENILKLVERKHILLKNEIGGENDQGEESS